MRRSVPSTSKGKLSDRFGRRPMLLICIFGTFIRHNSSLRCPHTLAYSSSFLLLGLANSLEMLFFSRILDGLLGGDIALAQAYIAGALSVRSFSSLFFFFCFWWLTTGRHHWARRSSRRCRYCRRRFRTLFCLRPGHRRFAVSLWVPMLCLLR